MRLHEDKESFKFLIDEIAREYGVRADVLEKDYYVTLLLHELAGRDRQGYAYFKGGTALYKALRSIRRFSEDIDLTVYIDDCETSSQAKKRLERATLGYICMQKGEISERNRGSITCEYLYDSLYTLDSTDVLQRFGRVKVEATSFTISKPTTGIEIAPHLYELAGTERQKILREQFDVSPFTIETITPERIFIDKIFAAEFYYERKMYGDVAKHVYDLTVLMETDAIKAFFSDMNEVKEIIALKRAEERERKGGVDESKDIANFEYFFALEKDGKFAEKFEEMQRIYVFSDQDVIAKERVIEVLSRIRDLMDVEW